MICSRSLGSKARESAEETLRMKHLMVQRCVFEALFLALVSGEECDVSSSWLQMKMQVQKHKSDEGYYWTHRGGDQNCSSAVDWEVPLISHEPSWVWPNEEDDQVRFSPLIDDKAQIYIATTRRVLKFSRNGQQMWTWMPGGLLLTCPVLYQGRLYGLAAETLSSRRLFAVDMETGTAAWNVTIEGYFGLDANSLFAADGVLLLPQMSSRLSEGTNSIRALNVSDGHQLWDYTGDQVLWNFAPSSPGDGTLLFSGCCGAVFRLALANGSLIWRQGEGKANAYCGTGGGTLGPNGVFYAESNQDGHGKLVAYDVSDGRELWQADFDYPGGLDIARLSLFMFIFLLFVWF